MKLNILGMNGPYPAPGSACSGYFVCSGDTRVQLDMGTGTLQALTGLTAPESLTGILLSHWHYDHTSDLLPLIYRMADAVASGSKPMNIWAPVDESSPIRKIIASSGVFILHDLKPGDLFTVGNISISVFQARHPVPAVMYRLEAEGKVLCFTGDTNTVDGLEDFARNADLLLADGLFTDQTWSEKKPHLSARHTAVLAREAGCRTLIITHLNPAIDSAALLKEAREEYPRAELARCGAAWNL